MSEVRIKTWPLAVVGSVLVHVSALTGVYLAPAGHAGSSSARAGGGLASEIDTVPLYLMPDALPPDVAARLAAENEAAAKVKAPSDEPSDAKRKPDLLVLVKPEPELEPIPVQLGVVDGPKIQTETWLKFDSPLEHGARLAPVEQPQQDLNATPSQQGNPGAGGADGKAPAVPVSAPSTEPAQASKPSPTAAEVRSAAAGKPVEPTPTQPSPAQVVAPAEQQPIAAAKPTADIPEGPKQSEIKKGNSGGDAPKVEQSASEPKVLPVEAAGPTPQPNVGSAGAQGAAAKPTDVAVSPKENSRAPGSPGVPGATQKVASDRDSDASSVKRAAVFRNGKVEAGEGLDIRTVRPDFSLTTKALRQPRSPTLEIIFGKDGRAKRVRVLKSSGFPSEVDEPVVTALYNWRAKGRLLDQLPSRPDATVALEITIILD